MTSAELDQRPVPPLLLRGVARALDLGVQIALLDAAFRVSAVLPQGLIRVPEDVLVYVDVGVGLSAFVLYTTLAEWLGGATLGKVLTGLRVVPAGTARSLTLREAVVRSVAFFVDSLFFGLVAYSAVARSEQGQRLGDEWADTRVVWRGDAPDGAAWRGWPVGAAASLAWVLASYLIAS